MRKTYIPRFFTWSLWSLVAILATFGISSTTLAQGGDASRGKQLYQQNCAVCHGDNAQGRVGARLAKDFPGIRVDALLRQTISNGVQGSVMPAWSKAKGGPLSDADIGDIAAFIESLGHQAPAGPTARLSPTTALPLPSPIATFPPGNAQRGASLFAQNCAVCHGDRGEGRIGATLSKDWPGVNAESFIEATIARGVPGSKMPAWGVAYGGPLSPQDIADTATFVRNLKQPGTAVTPASSGPQDVGLLASPLALACGGIIALIILVALALGLVGARSRR